MNWFNKLMTGRYGVDQLSIGLLVLTVLLTIISQLTSMPVFTYIGYIPILAAIYRIFSKKTEKRRMENYKFSMIISPVYSRFRKTQAHMVKAKTHKMFKCPNCKAGLWVPKGKGTIIVTCTKCRTEFRERT